MDIPFSVKVNSEDETIRLAEKFSGILKPGDIIALNGQLGAGKTFFIKHLLKNFGIEYVSSPTFALVNEYTGTRPSDSSTYFFNHFDFYRINRVEELYDIGFEEYLIRDNSVTLIEWAEMMPEVLPKRRIEISFKVNDDFSREISINKLPELK